MPAAGVGETRRMLVGVFRLWGAVGGCEPDLALAELAAQLGEAVLGEVASGRDTPSRHALELLARACS